MNIKINRSIPFIKVLQLIKKEVIEYHHFATSNKLIEIGIKHQWLVILEKRKKGDTNK